MSNASRELKSAGWSDTRLSVARTVLLAITGSIFLAVCARIQVPMWPVPMTMQSFGVMALALALGARVAAGSVGLYLTQGALGLPLFAGGGGLAYMVGPTGGYLLGFLAMAWLVGTLADRGWNRTIFKSFASAVMGAAVLYLFGGLWLATLIGAKAAFTQGVLPFLFGDILKAGLAAISVCGILRLFAPLTPPSAG